MNFSKTLLTHHSHILFLQRHPKFQKNYFLVQSHLPLNPLLLYPPPPLQLSAAASHRKNCSCSSKLITGCISHPAAHQIEPETSPAENAATDSSIDEQEEEGVGEIGKFSADESLWNQMVEIVKFSGPAVGLWLCGPLMSLIDTAVIGQGSSVELAALGPGTVFIDNTSYAFMFLSIATSNLVATSLARRVSFLNLN